VGKARETGHQRKKERDRLQNFMCAVAVAATGSTDTTRPGFARDVVGALQGSFTPRRAVWPFSTRSVVTVNYSVMNVSTSDLLTFPKKNRRS
jgi:hypothetical protein